MDTLLTALAPAIWGSTYIVTSELLPPDRPFTAALLRVLPAGLILVCILRVAPRRKEWGRLLVLSALNIDGFQALLFLAAYRLPGGLAAVLGALQPLIVMLLVWGLEGRRPAGLALVAGALGVPGMAALLFSPAMVWNTTGVLAAAAGAASMATGTYLTRRWHTSLPVFALTGWQLLLGGLMLVPLAVLVDAPLPRLSALQISAYAYLSLAGALLAYALWFRGLKRLSPVAVSSLGLLSPLTAVTLGWLVLDQSMNSLSLAGLLVVMASIFIMQRTCAPRPLPATPLSLS